MNASFVESDISKVKDEAKLFLKAFFAKEVYPDISTVNIWGNDALTRLLQTTSKGKMLRATLMIASERVFSSQSRRGDALIASAALELIQTGLLIHDDIMDNDEMRRGIPSMHIQYRDILSKGKATNTQHSGQAMAMCVGDMAFFIATQLLSGISEANLSRTLILLYSKEIAKVCVGQMQDVYGGITHSRFSQDTILSLYAHKTGRYTCGLPLVTGAMIAGASDQTIKQLWKLGTALGIVFQMQDDQYNLFSDEKTTGKPMGSDLREKKQTLLWSILFDESDTLQQTHLSSIFGNQSITSSDLDFVRAQATTPVVKNKLEKIMLDQEQQITDILNHLQLEKEQKSELTAYIDYIRHRNT